MVRKEPVRRDNAAVERGRHIVIIGGGVIGSAIAAFLGERGAADGVTIIERDPSYRRASSALSTSSIRQQFSTALNIQLSQAGMAFLRSVRDEVGLVEPGYLYVASEAGRDALARQHAVQRRSGAPVALLSPSELKRRFPWLDVAGLALGSLGVSGEGWFDGYGLLQLFRRRAMTAGARYVTDEAIGFECEGSRIAAVRLAGGDKSPCDIAINAAGPWAASVAAWAGVCAGAAAPALGLCVRLPRAPGALSADDRSLGSVVPAGRRVHDLRHARALRGRSGRAPA